MADDPSNLYINSEKFRTDLIARNPYNLDNEYRDTTKLSLRNSGKIAEGVASVIDVIPQFNSLGFQNSLAQRVLGGTTPMTEIATVMLGKQMFYNSASHLAQQNLPSIDLTKVLKGQNPFTKNINYTITNDSNAGLLDKIVSTAFFKTSFLGEGYPFSPSSTNADYIKNTGKGQLAKFYQNINRNFYKQINDDDKSDVNSQVLKEYSGKEFANEPLKLQTSFSRLYFNFDDNTFHPYFVNTSFNTESIDFANVNMRIAVVNSSYDGGTQQYAPNQYFVNSFFGLTNKTSQKDDIFNYVSNQNDDDIKNKLVWGRDGVSDRATENISELHGDGIEEQTNLISASSFTDYNIQTGLLEYTKNLLNASNGFFVDITRKAFKDGNKIVGYNGSPLWQSNDSTYANTNNTSEQIGIRQHSMMDRYDRFAKAIRFNGNIAYGGNPNSVIHQSVMPRIHPTRDEGGEINNKNLMFSIENLAIQTIKRDTYGVINDEWGSAIPLSEVGPFNGRMMWFPPYDLQLNETATAKYESTVMVGRNEPMYNYMNSERTATLNFTLLIDYPPHVRNYPNDDNYKRNLADFFAFGGDPLPTDVTKEELRKRIKDLEDELKNITTEYPPNQNIDDNLNDRTIYAYFVNGMPQKENDATTEETAKDKYEIENVFDLMYKDPLHYEIIDGCLSANDGNGFGLNKNIYFMTGLTSSAINTYVLGTLPSSFSQYNIGDVVDQFGKKNSLNEALLYFFKNPQNRPYYDIIIEGTASKLYEGPLSEAEYNKALGQRRIRATEKLVRDRLKTLFPNDGGDKDIKFPLTTSTGSEGGSVAGSRTSGISNRNVKEERRSVIKITRNSNVVPTAPKDLNSKDKEDVVKIQEQISALNERLDSLSSDHIYETRKDAILNTYEAIRKNNYYPIFHTQTPEDFHRRLTFLQQCTRQGAAKRYDVVESNGELRARNSVFGRQPICILRVGDFFYTKVIIDSVAVDYNETTWDMNPEGFGLQPMIAKITLQMKLIGGQSLKGPIDALQNAVSFNYYANSTYSNTGMYARPSKIADSQESYVGGVNTENKINTQTIGGGLASATANANPNT